MEKGGGRGEVGRNKLLGRSSSALAGGTARFPQLLHVNQNKKKLPDGDSSSLLPVVHSLN